MSTLKNSESLAEQILSQVLFQKGTRLTACANCSEPVVHVPKIKSELTTLIAAALRLTREETLEEAAALIERQLACGCDCSECRSMKTRTAAIRALREKGE